MEFPGFLGNKRGKEALNAAFSTGRFPHAVILQGDPGTGRHTLARLLAQALVCRDREHAPCGVCPSCVRAQAGSHPDIRSFAGSGASGSLTVETVKAMTEDASRSPLEAELRVCLVDIGDNTLPAAQNKLLKLLEEPPGNTVFLLICKNARSLLETIRSRAQIVTLTPPALEEAADWLVKNQGADPKGARELATLCGGNLGQMQAEVQEGGAGKAFGIAQEMVKALLSPGGHPLLKASAPLLKDRALCRAVLARLTVIFRDACVLRYGEGPVLGGAPELAQRLCALPARRLVRLPELTEEYSRRLDRNANSALLVTCLCAQLRAG